MNDVVSYLRDSRHVDHLVHFTPRRNLELILKGALRPTSDLDPNSVVIPDKDRFDENRDRLCLSISFPNYLMMYRYKDRLKVDLEDFIILLIPVGILDDFAENDVFFYPQNAAAEIPHQKRKGIPSHNNHGLPAAKRVFAEEVTAKNGTWIRNEQIPMYLPTNPQAEIQIRGSIPADKIARIVARGAGIRKELRRELPTHSSKICGRWNIRNTEISVFDWPDCWEIQRKQLQNEAS